MIMTRNLATVLAVVALTGCVFMCASDVPPQASKQDGKDSLCYCLLREVIGQVDMGRDSNGRDRVFISLNQEETERFRVLTGENIGRDMLIVAGGQVVFQHRIDYEVNMGEIHLGPFDSEAEATATMDLVGSPMTRPDCEEVCKQWLASHGQN